MCRQLSKSTRLCRTSVALLSSLSNRDINEDQQISSVGFPTEFASASEFDSILHDFNEVMDSDVLPFSDEQLLDSLLHFDKKSSHHSSGVHFATVLKTLAARRYQLDGDGSYQKRRQLIQALMVQISENNVGVERDRAKSAEVISNCVWALGTLKITKEDFFSPSLAPPSSGNSNATATVLEKGCGSWDLLLAGTTELCGELNDGNNGVSRCMSRVQLFRLISGLGKMGLKWKAMPPELQNAFLRHTSNIASSSPTSASAVDANTISTLETNVGSHPCTVVDADGTSGDSNTIRDSASSDCTSRDTSREVASSLYILGQIGATRDLLPEGYLQVMLAQLNQDHVIQGTVFATTQTNKHH